MKRFLIFAYLFVLAVSGVSASEEGADWDYEGENGPEYWGSLHPDYDLCSKGRNQSPIDLVADIEADLPEVAFDYRNPGILQEINTGHAIQESVPEGNFVSFLGGRFELKQLHFHSPSEHTVAGQEYPMEVHLVHQNTEGDYVVVGLLFQEGERNPLMDRLPSFRVERGEDPYGDPVDYNEFITNRGEYFLYNGSLTTPPCTEGVQWIVFKQPIIASSEQIQHYYDLLGFDNNRPIQPHNSRVVVD